jgi:hypothetical protein
MGHAVAYLVEALCYKPEGRRFQSRMKCFFFSIYQILPAALWSWDRLSLERKWAPGIFLGVKNGRPVYLTTLPPYISRMSENVGASTSRNLKASTACTEIALLKKSCATRGPGWSLEIYQWCRQLCFVAAAVITGRCLPLVNRAFTISALWRLL